MKFGLRRAPSTIERALDIIINGVLWKNYLVYLDKVSILSTSVEEHVANVDEVISLLCAAGIYMDI